MKKYIKVITLSVSIFIVGIVNGQDLGVDTLGGGLNIYPDTLTLNDNYTHQVTIMNYDGASFTGNIYLMAAIDTNGTLFSIDTVGSVFVSGFGFGDTVSIFYNETYNIPNGYKTGDNIVVVWPISDAGTTRDTLRKNIHLDNPISVNSYADLDDGILIYPNPVHDIIYFEEKVIKNRIKQVRILNMNGQVVLTQPSTKSMNIAFLPQGIYFIEINGNKKSRYKIIKK